LEKIRLQQAEIHELEKPNVSIVEEQTQQIEELTIQIQKLKDQTCKEKQMLQEQIQGLEKSLESAVKKNCTQQMIQEVKQVQSKIQNYNQELKNAIEDTAASDSLTLKRNVETAMKQLNVEECDLNLRVAQLIATNPVHREMFQLIIAKLQMFFNDCRTISLKYVDTTEELKCSVGNAAAELEKTDVDFFNVLPATGLIVQLIGYIVNVFKEMQLQQLFQNVSSFESKILPENTLIFAKLLALKVVALELFQVQKQQTEESEVVENCCERVFVVLTIGLMNYLLENKVGSAHITIRALEQLVEEMLPILEIGKTKEEFQEKLKERLGELTKREEKEEEMKEEQEINDQTSKEKDDEFEIVNAVTTSLHVLKEGWLEKAGEHFFSQAQRRKFTLLSDGSLFYEKGDGENAQKNKIDLTKATIIKRFGNFQMTIEMPGRKWTFKCLTINDRDGWMDAMASIDGVKCESCDQCSDKN